MVELVEIDLGNGRKVTRVARPDDPDRRSHLSAPMIQTDSIEIKSMVDGRIYTSKAALRRSYRERGYIEVGNEQQRPPKKAPPDRKGVRNALRKAAAQTGFYSD